MRDVRLNVGIVLSTGQLCLQKRAAILLPRKSLEESLPGPRYLELKSVPRDELAMAAFGAKPNAIATSWTD